MHTEAITTFCDLCFDFDGVIHSYTSGWQGIDNIPDALVNGALPMLYHYLEHWKIAIFSARSSQPEGRAAMKTWLDKHDERFRQTPHVNDGLLPLPRERNAAILGSEKAAAKNWHTLLEKGTLVERITFPSVKPAAKIYIDDRAYRFCGHWPSDTDLQDAVTPWYQRHLTGIETLTP